MADDKNQVLAYFSVRQEEDAARTVFSSAVGALKFLEDAGEWPNDHCFSALPAVVSAVKEHEAKRRRKAEELGEQLGRRQAQPLRSCLQ